MATADALIAQAAAGGDYGTLLSQLSASMAQGYASAWDNPAYFTAVSNLAAAATSFQDKIAYQPMYTQQVAEPVSVDTSGNVTFTAGVSEAVAQNTYWTTGAGAAAVAPMVAQDIAAETAARNAALSSPPHIVSNGDGSATAYFASGATHTVTAPNAVEVLTQTYSAAPVTYIPDRVTPPMMPQPGSITGAAVQQGDMILTRIGPISLATAVGEMFAAVRNGAMSVAEASQVLHLAGLDSPQNISALQSAQATMQHPDYAPPQGGNMSTPYAIADAQITSAYHTYLGREVESADEWAYYDGLLAHGAKIADIVQAIANSAEAKAYAQAHGTSRIVSTSPGATGTGANTAPAATESKSSGLVVLGVIGSVLSFFGH